MEVLLSVEIPFSATKTTQFNDPTPLNRTILIKYYSDKEELEKLSSTKTDLHLNVDVRSQHFQGYYCTSFSFQSHSLLTCLYLQI